MRDAVVYTDDVDLYPYARSIRPDGYTYLVYWGSGRDAIVKVGSAEAPRRWRGYLARGGRIGLIVRSSHSVRLETELQLSFGHLARMAFKSKQDAEPYLGSHGAGWTECYRMRPEVALREMEWVLASG